MRFFAAALPFFNCPPRVVLRLARFFGAAARRAVVFFRRRVAGFLRVAGFAIIIATAPVIWPCAIGTRIIYLASIRLSPI